MKASSVEQVPANSTRRDDLLVSICFSDMPIGETAHTSLKAVANSLNENFRYWEILIVVEASDQAITDASKYGVRNLRQLKVRAGTSTYRSRVLAATEAIGDVVVLTTPAEVGALDLILMIDNAFTSSSIVTGRRDKTSVFDPALRAMGAAGGFRVSTADMQTAAYPRTLLAVLLSHPDSELALRFAPLDSSIPVKSMAEQVSVEARSFRDIGRRLGLVQKLLVAIAPRVLTGIALLSGLVFISSILYVLYAVYVWLFIENVQPGWFTTSIVLSLTAAFLGIAIFGLSVGLQKTIDLLTPDDGHGILDEQSTVDLFGDVMQELNVVVDGTDANETPALPHYEPSH